MTASRKPRTSTDSNFNLVPRASVVERKALAKSGYHMTNISNIVRKFSCQLLGCLISVINFPNILENLVM